MQVNFYLKAAQATKKRVYLYLSHQGKRWSAPTGIRIPATSWDHKKQRIKAAEPNAREQNLIIEKLNQKLEKAYWKTIRKESRAITVDEFRTIVQKHSGRLKVDAAPKKVVNFIDYAKAIYTNKLRTGTITKSSYDVISTYIKKLQEFQKIHPFGFEDINSVFLENLVAFGADIWKRNTLIQYLNLIKTIMNSAAKDKLHKNKSYKHLSLRKEIRPRKIYVSLDALERLYNYKPSDYYLERTRNNFLITAFTGLRYSDLSKIDADRIRVNNQGVKVLDIITKKTDAKITIPIHPVVEAIIKQHENKIDQVKIKQANNLLKDLFKEAGFNDVVFQSHKVDNVRHETRHEFWELVTTHTARRSFATNCHMAGIQLNDIKELMGHSDIAQTERYICATSNDAASVAVKTSFYAEFKLRPA